jgi:hypothetical protein
MPHTHTTVHKILRKRLKCKSHKYQLLQHVTAQDKEVRYKFCSNFRSSVKYRSQELDRTTYSNAFSFHECVFYFMSNVTAKWYTFLICKHPVCFYYIIGYLLTFNTRFVFSSFSIFGYGDMFRYQYTILRPILQMFANNQRTK